MSRGMSKAEVGAGMCGGGSLMAQHGFYSLPRGALLEGLLEPLHSTRLASPSTGHRLGENCKQRARPPLTKLLCDEPWGHGGAVLCCPLVRSGDAPLPGHASF